MDPFGDTDDPWPDDPDEFDPDTSTEPDIDSIEEVPKEVFRPFVGAAVALNVAILGLALGAMLIYFRGDWLLGSAALAAAAVAAATTVWYYRGFKRGAFSEDETTAPETNDETPPDGERTADGNRGR